MLSGAFFLGIDKMRKIRTLFEGLKRKNWRERIYALKWIGRYGKKHIWSIVLYTLLGLSGSVTGLLSSLVSKDLVDIITGHNAGELLRTFAVMLGVTLATMMIGQVTSFVSSVINTRVSNDIKADVFDIIMETEWEELSQFHSGDLTMRWGSDASIIASGVLTLFPNFLISLFRFATALYMVIQYDASFAVITLVCAPISLLTTRKSMKMMRKANMGTVQSSTQMSSFNQETFSNIQTVKAFDLLPLYSARLRSLQKDYLSAQVQYQKATGLNSVFVSLVSMLTNYIAYGWGIYRVWSGVISYGTMTMFLTLSSSLSGTVNSLINLFPNAVSLSNASKRLMELAELPKEDFSQRDEVKKFYEKHAAEGVGIAVRNMTYAYGEGGDVFESASMEAHPHEIIAFVGPSGEGKTTMMRFLLSIIRAKKGSGYLCAGNTTPEGGGECMELTASVRQLIAYVPQGNTMFSGTIAENMRNVKADATDEEIIAALKMACAWDFVKKLPEGINNVIRERGGGFSEGQAQRLSIARALVRRSPILLLDEATSALDIMTEHKVLQNILQDDYPRTTVVTTHRPSVLKSCNRVYKIRNLTCELLDEKEVDQMLVM